MKKRFKKTAVNAWRGLKEIFFPSICFSCDKKIREGFLCAGCSSKITFLHPPLCNYCAKPVAGNKTGLCIDCLHGKHHYAKLFCAAVYREPLENLIHLFKYKNCDYLAELFTGLIAAHLEKTGFQAADYDFVTAVPMHPSKLKERGYNQAGLLAKDIANYFKIPLKDGIIYETKEKASQARLKKNERVKNVAGCFAAQGKLDGPKIIIIDDIFTTGSTVNECARVLKEAGAQSVTVMALAKTME